MIHFVSTLFLVVSAFAVEPNIQDFKSQVYHGDGKHPQLWAIEVSPPVEHHFNLEAPRTAKFEKSTFEAVQESPEKILFQLEGQSLHSGVMVEVSAFVCDSKKTYCLKKKMNVLLDEKNSKVISEKFSNLKLTKPKIPSVKTNQTELFIDNDIVKAIAESKKSKKPLLIDFYGIWCPPCNLYDETVFNTPAFAKVAKNFVLLKLDVDDEKSFELKSKFKIGGYPTLLIAKLNEKDSLEEIERVVGYLPLQEFNQKLTKAYQHRNDSQELRWKDRLEEFLSIQLEQKNYNEVIQLTETAKDAKVLIYRWIAENKKNVNFLKDPKNLTLVENSIKEIANNIESKSSDTLVQTIDFLNDEFWLKQDQYFKIANSFIDQLLKRIDPKTKFVKGTELTAADLDSIRMDLAETINNEKLVIDLRKKVIGSYEKLISFFDSHGSKDLRSMNLEYGFLLWKDGRIEEAKKLYDHFIKKYPAEFTFYFAATKMYLGIKDYTKAREYAEKALNFSYGDNRIRSMERLITVMVEQGEKKEALMRGNEFLKNLKIPEGLNVRTTRYVESLKKLLAKIEKENEGKK